MAAHRAWRFKIDTNGSGYAACATLAMRTAIGGPDITQGAGGTPISNSDGVGVGPASSAFDNNPSTSWQSYPQTVGQPGWIGYDFGAGNSFDVVQMDFTSEDYNYAPNDNPITGGIEWSDDLSAWTRAYNIPTQSTWPRAETRTFYFGPQKADNLKASQTRAFAIYRFPAESEQISSAKVFGIFRFPAINEQISSLTSINVVKRDSPIEISQLRTIAVVKGRIANPKVRAWTFTLDGHDFYVLRLGDKETLVYDTASKQWVQWDSPTSGAWRPNIGTPWIGAQKLGFIYGSDIVAGDDSFGLLWFLDPRQAWDDATDVFLPTQQVAFTRIVTGQVLAAARQQLPCYALFLNGDNYGLVATDFSPFVRLDTSDDQGRTFDQHDTLTVNMDSNDQPDTWYSLGQFGSPGRIFRITDNGVYQRIDAAEMNDDAG